MHAALADHLVLEVDADGTDIENARDIGSAGRRIVGIGAFEVNGDGQLRRSHDQPRDIGEPRHRHLLAIAETMGGRHRPASGGKSLGTGFGHGLGAAGVPDIIEHHRVALPMQGSKGERLFLLAHCISSTNNPLGFSFPSCRSSHCFRQIPPPYPVSEPSEPMQRWQGMTMAIRLEPLALATARAAWIVSTSRAMSP
ncbi:hypothetical protein D9M70_518130 [compost metagenome]